MDLLARMCHHMQSTSICVCTADMTSENWIFWRRSLSEQSFEILLIPSLPSFPKLLDVSSDALGA